MIHQLKSSPCVHSINQLKTVMKKGMDTTELGKGKAHIIVKIIEYLPNAI